MWIAKKYLVGKLNDLLKDYKNNVAAGSSRLCLWTGRVRRILAALDSCAEKVSDGKLTAEELETAVADVEKIIKEW